MKSPHRHQGFAWSYLLIFLLCIISAGYGWFYYQQQKAVAQHSQQFITETVRRGDIRVLVNASGKIYPQKIVTVSAQVSGEIAKLAVKIGDIVKEGDVLAEIDARTQENAISTAQAQLSSQQAALSTAQAQFTQAQQAYTRANNLYKRGAGSKEAQESAFAALKRAKNAVTEAQASIRQSELMLADAKLTLGYTQVSAPISGTVIAVAVEEGQAINAVQSSPTLITLARTEVMTIKAEIAEADISLMKIGLPATATLLGKNRQSYQGQLSRIDPAPKEISDNRAIDSASAIYYYGHINVDNSAGLLRYGMTATISIEVDKAENALLIPMTAIQRNPNGETKVSVLIDGQAQTRKIETGLEDGVQIQVLSGLNEGEAVIISHAADAKSAQNFRMPRVF